MEFAAAPLKTGPVELGTIFRVFSSAYNVAAEAVTQK
jgi:hypothetical protein